VNEVERAIAEIADIRAQLAASTRFRGIAPQASALLGILALAIAFAQTLWPDTLARDGLRYIAVWSGFTMASIIIVAIEAIARTRRLHAPMAVAILRSTLRLVVPFVAAGSVITFVVCRFAPDATWILPGLWQMLIALFGFSVLPSMPRAILWPACWYLVCGGIVLWLAASSGMLSPWMMGVPFAIGQPAAAWILYHDQGARDG
jgi:hypothetical protein